MLNLKKSQQTSTKTRKITQEANSYKCNEGFTFVRVTHFLCTLLFQFFGAVFASKGYPFKNIFNFTTAGDCDCLAAVERLPALHYSVDFIFLSFGIMGFIAEL